MHIVWSSSQPTCCGTLSSLMMYRYCIERHCGEVTSISCCWRMKPLLLSVANSMVALTPLSLPNCLHKWNLGNRWGTELGLSLEQLEVCSNELARGTHGVCVHSAAIPGPLWKACPLSPEGVLIRVCAKHSIQATGDFSEPIIYSTQQVADLRQPEVYLMRHNILFQLKPNLVLLTPKRLIQFN